MKQPLRLVDQDEPTAADVERARIEQSWRAWSVTGWKPFQEPQKHPTVQTDEILARSQYVVVTQSRTPIYRRIWRWVVERVRALKT